MHPSSPLSLPAVFCLPFALKSLDTIPHHQYRYKYTKLNSNVPKQSSTAYLRALLHLSLPVIVEHDIWRWRSGDLDVCCCYSLPVIVQNNVWCWRSGNFDICYCFPFAVIVQNDVWCWRSRDLDICSWFC